MTGAQIPEGADAVVMFEQTVENGDTFTIRKPLKRMKCVAKRRRNENRRYCFKRTSH